MTDPAFARLHAACAALGTRLFTITIDDEPRGICWRAYTSHPVEYPLSGTKPLTRDGEVVRARVTLPFRIGARRETLPANEG